MSIAINKNEYVKPQLVENSDNLYEITLLYAILSQSICKYAKLNIEEHKNILTLAGSDTEELNVDEYFKIKNELSQLDTGHELINRGLKYCSTVAPDNHIYVEHQAFSVSDLFDWTRTFLESKKEFEIKDQGPSGLVKKSFEVAINDDYNFEFSYDQISEANEKEIFRAKVIQKNINQKHDSFHIEFTNTPTADLETRNDRRQLVRGVPDITKVPISLDALGFIKLINKRLKHLNSNIMIIDVNIEKTDAAYLENITRNIRKIISGVTSHKDMEVNFKNLYINGRGRRKIKNILTSEKYEKLVSTSTSFQIETYYREIFVAAGWDAKRTVEALSQSGLDILYFGGKIDPTLFKNENNLSQLQQFLEFIKIQKINLSYLADEWQKKQAN